MKNFIALLIGSGENCSDILYATGISTPDDFIFFEYQDIHCAVMSPLEIDRAAANAKKNVLVKAEKDFNGPSRINIISSIAEQCRCSKFVVPADFPLGIADEMRKTGLEVSVGTTPFFPEREFKTEDEVNAIIQAQRAAEAGFAKAVEALEKCSICNGLLYLDGEILTSEKLRAVIDCEILMQGMLPTGTICAGGSQAAQPHNAGSGALKADSPIVMDIFPRSPITGYWGDLTRTVVKGKAPDIVKKAYHAVFEAREYAKSIIKPGVYGASVHCAAEAILEKHHFFTGANELGQFGFFHGLGHGVGLDIHEMPRLSPKARTQLKGGEVITVEPGLYYPEWGGIRLEDIVCVTSSGNAECLTKAPDFLEID